MTVAIVTVAIVTVATVIVATVIVATVIARARKPATHPPNRLRKAERRHLDGTQTIFSSP